MNLPIEICAIIDSHLPIDIPLSRIVRIAIDRSVYDIQMPTRRYCSKCIPTTGLGHSLEIPGRSLYWKVQYYPSIDDYDRVWVIKLHLSVTNMPFIDISPIDIPLLKLYSPITYTGYHLHEFKKRRIQQAKQHFDDLTVKLIPDVEASWPYYQAQR